MFRKLYIEDIEKDAVKKANKLLRGTNRGIYALPVGDDVYTLAAGDKGDLVRMLLCTVEAVAEEMGISSDKLIGELSNLKELWKEELDGE